MASAGLAAVGFGGFFTLSCLRGVGVGAGVAATVLVDGVVASFPDVVGFLMAAGFAAAVDAVGLAAVCGALAAGFDAGFAIALASALGGFATGLRAGGAAFAAFTFTVFASFAATIVFVPLAAACFAGFFAAVVAGLRAAVAFAAGFFTVFMTSPILQTRRVRTRPKHAAGRPAASGPRRAITPENLSERRRKPE